MHIPVCDSLVGMSSITISHFEQSFQSHRLSPQLRYSSKQQQVCFKLGDTHTVVIKAIEKAQRHTMYTYTEPQSVKDKHQVNDPF